MATSGNDDVGEIFPNETGYVYICQHDQTPTATFKLKAIHKINAE